ncbi:MAG: ROK family protein [Candidatus Obscuribacterales bacterium]|nr:ROK family protein [Candidatus Obscuribacterales bacterium]
MTHCYCGIDIGGTKIAGGLVDEQGRVSSRREVPTPVRAGGSQILANAIALARQIIATSTRPVKAIGIGAGGQIDADKGLVFSATEVLPGWKGQRITEAFERELGLPTKVDNDVNVLGLGESRFGAARHLRNASVVFLALGTGVGGAIIIDGKVVRGSHWSGGELGHILVSMDDNARVDLGGTKGTLEAYCSGPALVNIWRELSGHDSEDLSGYDVVADADRNPDGPGAKAIELIGKHLGFGLVTLANALDPDLIIIGGGLAALKGRLLKPAIAVLKERAMPGPATCPVVTAELEADAAIVGAASLVIPQEAEITVMS